MKTYVIKTGIVNDGVWTELTTHTTKSNDDVLVVTESIIKAHTGMYPHAVDTFNEKITENTFDFSFIDMNGKTISVYVVATDEKDSED